MMTMSGSIINFDQFGDSDSTKKKALMNAYQGGANSGFEIEGMDMFKDPTLTKEFPEMKEDIDLIISTESFVNKLVDFRHRVIAARGMSRGMAHELLELVPSLESHTTPRHFTEEISGIGVEMSLEAIDFKLWGLIAAAIAFVVGLIYKFVTWMMGGSGGKGEGGGSVEESVKKGRQKAEETAEAMDTQVEAVNDAEKVIKSVPSASPVIMLPSNMDHEKVARSHLPDAVKELVFENTKPLGQSVDAEQKMVEVTIDVKYILNSLETGHTVSKFVTEPSKEALVVYGRRTKGMQLILDTFQAFPSIANLTLSRLEIMQEMIDRLKDIKPEDELRVAMEFRAKLDTLAELDVQKVIKAGGEKFDNIQDWKQALRDHIASDHDAIKFDALSDVLDTYAIGHKRMSDVNWPGVAILFDVIEKAYPTLKEAEVVVEKASKAGGHGDDQTSGELAKLIMEPLRECQKEMVGMMEIYAIILKVYNEVMKNGAAVINLLRHNAHGIKALYEQNNQEVPELVEEMVTELEEAAALFFESLKNSSAAISVKPTVSYGDDGL